MRANRNRVATARIRRSCSRAGQLVRGRRSDTDAAALSKELNITQSSCSNLLILVVTETVRLVDSGCEFKSSPLSVFPLLVYHESSEMLG